MLPKVADKLWLGSVLRIPINLAFKKHFLRTGVWFKIYARIHREKDMTKQIMNTLILYS